MEFPGYAPDRFERLKDALALKGLKLAADAGELNTHGADVVYAYDAAAQKLNLTLKRPPWTKSMGWFTEQIKAAVEGQR
jgi:hypothetical protein